MSNSAENSGHEYTPDPREESSGSPNAEINNRIQPNPEPDIEQDDNDNEDPDDDDKPIERFTNFYIDEILKPNFGRNDFSCCTVFYRDNHVIRSRPRNIGNVLRGQSVAVSGSNRDSVSSSDSDVSSDSETGAREGRSDNRTRHENYKLFSKNSYYPLSVDDDEIPTDLSLPKTQKQPSSVSSRDSSSPSSETGPDKKPVLWPAWVYCTRYSDRPSSGPRTRRIRRKQQTHEKRPRTAFTSDQLEKLKQEFDHSQYLTEDKRVDLSRNLGLNESQIKIWFQNKRAKLKKSNGAKSQLALTLIAQGLYNHAGCAGARAQTDDSAKQEIDVES